MDYAFMTTPATFDADLAASTVPAALQPAASAVWAATDTSAQGSYEVAVAASTEGHWTVVRVGYFTVA